MSAMTAYVVWRYVLWIGGYSLYGFFPGVFVAALGYPRGWLSGLGLLTLPVIILILPIALDRHFGGGLYNALIAYPFAGFPVFGWLLSAIGFIISRARSH